MILMALAPQRVMTMPMLVPVPIPTLKEEDEDEPGTPGSRARYQANRMKVRLTHTWAGGR